MSGLSRRRLLGLVGLPASDPDTVTPVTVAGLADGTDEYPACLAAVRAAGEATVRSIRPK